MDVTKFNGGAFQSAFNRLSDTAKHGHVTPRTGEMAVREFLRRIRANQNKPKKKRKSVQKIRGIAVSKYVGDGWKRPGYSQLIICYIRALEQQVA